MGEHLAIRATAHPPTPHPHTHTHLQPRRLMAPRGRDGLGPRMLLNIPQRTTALQNKEFAAARLGCIGDLLGKQSWGPVCGLSVAFAFLQVQMGVFGLQSWRVAVTPPSTALTDGQQTEPEHRLPGSLSLRAYSVGSKARQGTFDKLVERRRPARLCKAVSSLLA